MTHFVYNQILIFVTLSGIIGVGIMKKDVYLMQTVRLDIIASEFLYKFTNCP